MAQNITPDCIDGGQSFSLSSEQLAAIVEITGYSFGNEQGKEIEILCREYLIERDFERGAVPLIGAREICDELVKRSSALALQLHFFCGSESMGNHDSEVMDGGSIDRDDAGAMGVVAA